MPKPPNDERVSHAASQTSIRIVNVQTAVTATAVSDQRGGDGRARTGDPLLAKQVLSQLSYAPMQLRTAVQVRRRAWAFLDSNQRPHGYQPCALTN
jgi:hypothetical protein